MIFEHLPLFHQFDPSLAISITTAKWTARDELAREVDWHGKCTRVLRLAATDRANAMRQLERFVDGIGSIGTLNPHDLRRNMWLDEQIALFDRETYLHPENPRAWKLVGHAHLLSGYFDAKHYVPAAESYAECIRRISRHSEGVIAGLVIAGIGLSTPNRPCFELGLAVAGAGNIEGAVYHLRFCSEGQADISAIPNMAMRHDIIGGDESMD